MSWNKSIALVIASTIALWGCSKAPEPGSSQPITIGALLPLTGNNASYGEDCRKGMDLYLERYNQAGKLGIRLIVEDTSADPKTAVSAINKLISVDRVQAIAGDMFSNTTLAAAPVAQQNGVVLVTPTASLEDIVAVGDRIFSIYPSDRYEGALDAKEVNKDRKRNVAVFQQQLQVFDTMSSAFIETIKDAGGKIAYKEIFPTGTNDFRSLLTKHSAQPVDAVYIAAYKTEAYQLIKQIREAGLSAQIYSQSTLYDPQTLTALGSAADGIVFSAPFFNDQTSTPVIDRFRAAYKSKHGADANVWAAYGYDVAALLVQGIEKAKAGGKPLHLVMAEQKLDGVTGLTEFFPNRTANKSMQIFTIRDGRFVLRVSN